MKRSAGLAACALLAACGSGQDPRTQVMVVVDAQTQVRALAREVDVEVRTGAGAIADWDVRLRRNITPGEGVEWPLEIALVPRDGDADRVYMVAATARGEDGEAVAEVRAISGYERAKTLSLLLLFEDSCLDRALLCGDEQTCRGGACIDAHVDAGDLPIYERDEDGEPVRKPFWHSDGCAGDGGSGDGGSADGGSGEGGGGGGGGTGGTAPRPGDDCTVHADCNDGDPCTGTERCVRNRCQEGTPFECPASGEPCRENVCVDDSSTATCEAQDAREGESCQEGDASSEPQASCARDYVCTAGACEPQTVESCAADQCAALAGCDPADGCVLQPLAATTECDDGDPCTQDDLCTGTDASCAGTAYSCDDSVACTVDSCDGAGGCTRVATDALCSGPCKSGTCEMTMGCLNVTFATDFTDCSDGDATTSADMCYRGECAGGSERAPTASCAVAGCDCTGFGSVRDLEYVGGMYAGLVEAAQSGAAGNCTSGTVSLVYEVTPAALTAYGTDTPNGAISESSSDLAAAYAISSAHVGVLNTTERTVDWLGTPVGDALAAQTPSLGSFRGVARHFEGSLATNRESHVWIWGSDTGTASTSRVVHCTWCNGVVIGGCDGTLTCSYGAGYVTSSIGGVLPYTNTALNTAYGGALQLVNLPSGAVRKRIYEDGAGKDYFAGSLETEDADGQWNGALRLAGAGQVLVYGSGTTNLRVCIDATNSGDTSCTAVTGLPNQSVRNYARATLAFNNSAVFMLANTGGAYYLLLLPVGVDPTVGSNWREIPLANSGTTVANAVAASPTSFMVFGKSAAVPYVWSWSP